MADTGTASTQNIADAASAALPVVDVPQVRKALDLATVFGLIFSLALIGGAIAMGSSNANFFNVPSLLIVVLGTMTATAVSYTLTEIKQSGNIIGKSALRKVYNAKALATALVDLAVIAKKKGLLALSTYESELQKDEFLARAIQMTIDGGKPQDINYILSQEIDFLAERHMRTASITRRASEVAPAMGLIGTLVGLVQMLADLENPDTIGPAMALALLTTFYGAIMGTVIMAPLAVKLEKNSRDEVMIKTMIKLAAVSIASQDNPRKLEMELNAALPPTQQIHYFD
jgi:chemotaxis protein MotA